MVITSHVLMCVSECLYRKQNKRMTALRNPNTAPFSPPSSWLIGIGTRKAFWLKFWWFLCFGEAGAGDRENRDFYFRVRKCHANADQCFSFELNFNLILITHKKNTISMRRMGGVPARHGVCTCTCSTTIIHLSVGLVCIWDRLTSPQWEWNGATRGTIPCYDGGQIEWPVCTRNTRCPSK